MTFYDWLISEKKMSNRGAKDVISRCKRVCILLNTQEIKDDSLDKLLLNEDFNSYSMFIKSQLKRSVVLSLEFGGNNE
ncbi:MAG: hypothetical protein IKH65_03455 [Clostridia bacterium]|nr:hypothetical protein [Clostridia bacterium]